MPDIGISPNTNLIDLKTGKATRDLFLLIQSITTAINQATSDYVLVDAVQTLTNKTLDGDANTFTDIPTSGLASRTGTGARVVTAAAAGTAGRLAVWGTGDIAALTPGTAGRVAQWSTGGAVEDATSIYVPAGTLTLEAMSFHLGSMMTSVTAGAWEYDGKAAYFAPQASARGVVPAVQLSVLASDFTGTDVNTAQPVFSASQDVLTLTANVAYQFEAHYWITRAAGAVSHTTATLFGGTATLTIEYLAQVTNPTGNALANVQQIVGSAATAVVLTAANIVATENVLVKLTGTIRCTVAGTLIPQFQFSAAPGGAPTVKANSYFRIWPIGVDTVASVGQWA